MTSNQRALRTSLTALLGASIAALLFAAGPANAMGSPKAAAPVAKGACAPDNAGLTLPEGYCATVYADNLGEARHMVVSSDGTLYVNTWISPFKVGAARPPGGYIVALRDGNGDGIAESVQRFGEDSSNKDLTGGTGIALHGGYLYAEASGKIVRYQLAQGQAVPTGAGEVVLDGLSKDGHNMHPIAIGADNSLYVNSGSFSNACQVTDRNLHSPGQVPCKELATRAGVWKYDATKLGQHFGPNERFVSNIRNSVAFAFAPSGNLYAVPHGRDQLFENWPEKYNEDQGSNLPAEMMVKLQPGAAYGWPNCYYDGFQKKYILAPEYGGDGKTEGDCAKTPAPAAFYPAHWAPNALLFVANKAFGDHYAGGAFIAFHGSWNRKEQQGYNVVFQPFDASGNPTANYEVFADGFAGANKTPFGATHRPSGLVMSADGSALFVSDDVAGRIYRIVKK